MVVTNIAKQFLALRMISGNSNLVPSTVGLGSGSGVALATDTALVTEVSSGAFTSIASGISFQVTWTNDFSTAQMSGLNLTEFGLKTSVGSYWNRESFSTVEFDGTNELRTEIRFVLF